MTQNLCCTYKQLPLVLGHALTETTRLHDLGALGWTHITTMRLNYPTSPSGAPSRANKWGKYPPLTFSELDLALGHLRLQPQRVALGLSKCLGSTLR